MSTEFNNGLFEQIKKAMDAQQSPDGAEEFGLFDQPINMQSLASNYDSATSKHEMIAIFAAEKQQYARELAAKFKSAGMQQFKDYEQKIKSRLKDKYEQVARTLLKEREQQLEAQYQRAKSEQQQRIVELQAQLSRVEQELARQQQGMQSSLEKEQATRVLYEDLIKASRNEFAQQAEQKFCAEYHAKLQQREQQLAAEFELRQQSALIAQEQQLTRKYSAQLAQQKEIFDLKMQQEIDAGTITAIQEQRGAFEREKTELLAKLESMRPDVEANKQRFRAEVEETVREEYAQKLADFKAAQEHELAIAKAAQEHELAIAKLELTQANQAELDKLIAAQRQKLAEEIHQENAIVMKYKEREIRDACDAQVLQVTLDLKQRQNQELQDATQDALAQQALQLQVDFNKKLAETTAKLTAEHEEKVKLAIIQERARLSQITTNEKKLLLEQQLANLEKEHQNALLELETRMLQGQDPRIQNVIDKIVAERVIELRRQMEAGGRTITNTPTVQAAVVAQPELTAQQQSEAVAQCEQRLRQEFQGILENQRKQAAENFNKHLKIAVRRALTKYKQRLSMQMSASREEELALLEDQLKERYAQKLQQQLQLLKTELAKEQNQFVAAENSKLKLSVEQQTAELRRQHQLELQKAEQEYERKYHALVEQERQKINMKFAQDKANLVKDLTARFTQEKQVAMQKYETELRDKLYKEMVKQKDYIQTKFAGSQDAALQDLKRRLDAQHKQEIERIKQGYFDPFSKRSQDTEIIAERGVEQLADRILAKFQVTRED